MADGAVAVRTGARPAQGPARTPKMARFANAVNRGVSPADAAREAGYSDASIRKASEIVARARRAGLILTVDEAREPLDLIRAAVSPADWTAIASRAVEQAKAGDAVARAWLTDRLIGKVTQPVDVRAAVGIWVTEGVLGIGDDDEGEVIDA